MGNRLETARAYAVSVVKKTVGVEGYNDFYSDLDLKEKRSTAAKIAAFQVGLLQFIFPEGTNRIVKECRPDNYAPTSTLIAKNIGGFLLDMSIMAAIALIANPNIAEGLTLKFIANPMTHASMDLQKLPYKELKPSDHLPPL